MVPVALRLAETETTLSWYSLPKSTHLDIHPGDWQYSTWTPGCSTDSTQRTRILIRLYFDDRVGRQVGSQMFLPKTKTLILELKCMFLCYHFQTVSAVSSLYLPSKHNPPGSLVYVFFNRNWWQWMMALSFQPTTRYSCSYPNENYFFKRLNIIFF